MPTTGRPTARSTSGQSPCIMETFLVREGQSKKSTRDSCMIFMGQVQRTTLRSLAESRGDPHDLMTRAKGKGQSTRCWNVEWGVGIGKTGKDGAAYPVGGCLESGILLSRQEWNLSTSSFLPPSHSIPHRELPRIALESCA